jgi:propionyl-CoA carboxylase beta chain
MNLEEKIAELKKRNQLAEAGGGEKRRERQHKEGKMSARERIEFLLDEGTFEETDKLVTHRCSDFGMAEQKALWRRFHHRLRPHRRPPGLPLRAGFHRVRRIALGDQCGEDRQDHGSCREDGRARDRLNDSGGARIQEGVMSLAGYADIFLRNTLYSGVVPQISAIMGPCAGGAVYSPAITDFVLMVDKTSYMFITGPGRDQDGDPWKRSPKNSSAAP